MRIFPSPEQSQNPSGQGMGIINEQEKERVDVGNKGKTWKLRFFHAACLISHGIWLIDGMFTGKKETDVDNKILEETVFKESQGQGKLKGEHKTNETTAFKLEKLLHFFPLPLT